MSSAHLLSCSLTLREPRRNALHKFDKIDIKQMCRKYQQKSQHIFIKLLFYYQSMMEEMRDNAKKTISSFKKVFDRQ